jgi:hypothetical protein
MAWVFRISAARLETPRAGGIHGTLVQPRKSLRIELPKEESVRLGRVGLIAVIGFGIGLVWPRVAGLRLVPPVPSERAEAASSAELSGAPAEAVPSASAAAVAAPEPPPPIPAPAPPVQERFTVGPGEVTSCRGAKGKKLETCDPVDFDAIARGRLATLSACEPVKRVHGVLSLGFDLDFDKDRVVGVLSGKSTSIPAADADALVACLRANLGEVSLAGIRHEHPRYTVFYRLDFSSGGENEKTDSPAPTDVTPVSGKATVAWDAALVRSAPSRGASVVARVLQGTRVSVNARHGDWYRVRYDAKGGEGWVFRSAIGM